MFTIKHTLPNGAETLYAAEYVTYEPAPIGGRPSVTIHQQHPHPPITINGGTVEVINSTGEICCRYDFNRYAAPTSVFLSRLHS